MDLVEAEESDVPALAEYWYALASEMESYDELNELAVDGPADAVAGLEGLLDPDDTTVYLLVEGGDRVGYLVLREGEHPSRIRSAYLDIVDLFVAEASRDEGIGSAALDSVRDVARDRGADYVQVSCEWHNDGARRFYETNGFEPKQVTYAQRIE